LSSSGISLGVEGFSWAPDASRIAFSEDFSQPQELSLYNILPDGSGRIHLIDTVEVQNPAIIDWQWSPDSSRIAYRADQETEGLVELFTVQKSGIWHRKMNQTLLAGGIVYAGWQWAPDSGFITFYADQETTKINDELYSSAADGSQRNRVNLELTSAASLLISTQHWLHNAARIIYQVTLDQDSVAGIYSVLPDGSDPKYLSAVIDVNQTLSSGYLASPDSAKILYLAELADTNTTSLHSISVDASNPKNLSNVGVVSQAQWLPDSSRIIYIVKATQGQSEELYSVAVDGSDKLKLY